MGVGDRRHSIRGPALLIAILVAQGQNILYIPGLIVHYASELYRGEAKMDAKDAAVIADQARMRFRWLANVGRLFALASGPGGEEEHGPDYYVGRGADPDYPGLLRE